VVLSGYGLDVRVERGQLHLRDGFGRQRQERTVARATSGLRRLVILGHTGSITLEAIRWLADVGATYLQIDADGRVLAAFGRQGTDRPALRRAQALAPLRSVGLGIARDLIAEKLRGQLETLRLVEKHVRATGAVEELELALARLDEVHDFDAVRLAEAQGAAAYWQAWSGVPVQYARRDAEHVPLHWRTFGSRSSPLTGGPRWPPTRPMPS
jgi:CRISPR/Cas system-associated endonuclease Cas1